MRGESAARRPGVHGTRVVRECPEPSPALGARLQSFYVIVTLKQDVSMTEHQMVILSPLLC